MKKSVSMNGTQSSAPRLPAARRHAAHLREVAASLAVLAGALPRRRCWRSRRFRPGRSRWSCLFPPGGSTGTIGRIVAQRLSDELGNR